MSGDAYSPCRVTTMVISIISCLILQAVTVNGIRYLSIPQNDLPSNTIPLHPNLVTDEYSLVSPGSVYGMCVANPYNKTEDYCIFYMETTSNVDSSKHLKKCKFYFDNCNEKECLSFLGREIVAIDKDKAVLKTQEKLKAHGVRRIDILDFSNCKVTPVPIRRDLIRVGEEIGYESSIIEAPTHDTFDVYFNFHGEGDTRSRYQGIFDFNGNTITMKNITNILPKIRDSNIVMHSPLKGRYIISQYQDSIEINRVAYNGSSEIVKLYHLNADSHDDDHSAISVTNELLTVCARYYEDITCGQFDNNGKFKFESTVRAPKSLVIYNLEAFNLPGGGLLLLTIRCNDIEKYGSCANPAKNFVVKKFDATGKVVGSLTIDWFSIKPQSDDLANPRFHFFENDEGEMCLSLFDWNVLGGIDTNILKIACFKDQDLYP